MQIFGQFPLMEDNGCTVYKGQRGASGFAARPTPLQVTTDTAPVFAAASFLASCLLAPSKADLVGHKGIYFIGVTYRDYIGRTFISSCRRVYGHEPVLCKAVVEVPWPHAASF